MRIVRYLSPTRNDGLVSYYGVPVVVRIGYPNRGWKDIEAVYQLHLPGIPGQAPLVIHWQTGMILAPIYQEDLPGSFTQQAQNAIDRKLHNVTIGKFEDMVERHEVINRTLEVVI